MRRKPYPIDVLSRANVITAAWEQIGSTVTIGRLTRKAIEADIERAAEIEAQIRSTEVQLKMLRNQRDAFYVSLWDKLKRIYEGVKALYGDDSAEYEMVGRTRLSNRKRRSRKSLAGEPDGASQLR